MSCDYHNRTDFRAFDVMVKAIDGATPDELRQALAMCREQAKEPYTHARNRATWGSFAKLLRTELKDTSG